MPELTRLESDVKDRIERDRKLNPSALCAREWIEQSDWSQGQIGRHFGDASAATVSTLCVKLGVKRDLRGGKGPGLATTSSPWGRGPDRLARRRELGKDCLRWAREGNALGEMGLELLHPLGITIEKVQQ